MQNLQIFESDVFGAIRTTQIDEQIYFVGKDVAEALGYTNPRKAIADHVDEEDKGVTIRDTLGGSQQMTIINESGLYSLVLGSKLPTAKAFKRWVTSEVLPSIRKNGMYGTPQTIEDMIANPDYAIKLLVSLKEERAKHAETSRQLEAAKPKVIFADAVSASSTTMLIGELAKLIRQNGYPIGEKRFFEWLRENGYLIKRKGADYNKPQQRYVEMGLFRIKENTIMHSDGHVTTSTTTKVTGKGQQYFINKFAALVKEGGACHA